MDGVDAGELADLRRRAYGPDADIADDPAAQARLAELERAVRATATPANTAGASPSSRPVAERAQRDEAPPARVRVGPSTRRYAPHSGTDAPREGVLASDRAAAPASVPLADDMAVAQPAEPGHEPPARSPRSTRARVVAVVGVVAIVAATALGTVALTQLNSPNPDFSMPAAPASEGAPTPIVDDGISNYWDIARDSNFTWHGMLGELDVWTTHTRAGHPCVLVGADRAVWNLSCVAPPLVPTVDWFVDEERVTPDDFTPAAPVGSVVRLEFRGDRVDVTVGRNDARA